MTTRSTNYFNNPTNIFETLKWLVSFFIIFAAWCIKIELNQSGYNYRITEISKAIDTQNQTLREIQTSLKDSQIERGMKNEKLSAIEAKVDLILAREASHGK